MHLADAVAALNVYEREALRHVHLMLGGNERGDGGVGDAGQIIYGDADT